MVPPLTVSPNYVRKTNNVELETSESYSSAINAKFREEEEAERDVGGSCMVQCHACQKPIAEQYVLGRVPECL